MAVALGLASSLPQSLSTDASPSFVSLRSPASASLCSRLLHSRSLVSVRATPFNPRCEIVSDYFVQKNEANSLPSGPSPLELLKSSASDRKATWVKFGSDAKCMAAGSMDRSLLELLVGRKSTSKIFATAIRVFTFRRMREQRAELRLSSLRRHVLTLH